MWERKRKRRKIYTYIHLKKGVGVLGFLCSSLPRLAVSLCSGPSCYMSPGSLKTPGAHLTRNITVLLLLLLLIDWCLNVMILLVESGWHLLAAESLSLCFAARKIQYRFDTKITEQRDVFWVIMDINGHDITVAGGFQ